jgi:multidrug efflux pump subunit AcrA (membrane-fusion protein)
MRVRVRANQADVNMLRTGQAATVRLDAYPGQVYLAQLDQLAPGAVTSAFSPKVRTFAATFRFIHADHLVMPDLSAAVDVELERHENVLLAPRSALVVRDGKTFLHVKHASHSEARVVTIGPVNDLYAVVTDGVENGTRIDVPAECDGCRNSVIP